jgi:hypothetical protein
MSMEIPQEVREQVGTSLTPEQLEAFWTHPHTLLDNKSPQELWRTVRGRKRVRSFIDSAKSTGMR